MDHNATVCAARHTFFGNSGKGGAATMFQQMDGATAAMPVDRGRHSAEPAASAPEQETEDSRWAEFSRFFHESYPSLAVQMHVILGDQTHAYQALQQAFARAWLSWDTVRALHDSSSWIREEANARAQRPDRWFVPTSQDARADMPQSPAPGTRAMLDALSGLPQVQRRALVLRHMANLSPRQLVELEGVPIETVRLRLSHGALALGHRMTDGGPAADHVALRNGRWATGPIDEWASRQLVLLERRLAPRPNIEPVIDALSALSRRKRGVLASGIAIPLVAGVSAMLAVHLGSRTTQSTLAAPPPLVPADNMAPVDTMPPGAVLPAPEQPPPLAETPPPVDATPPAGAQPPGPGAVPNAGLPMVPPAPPHSAASPRLALPPGAFTTPGHPVTGPERAQLAGRKQSPGKDSSNGSDSSDNPHSDGPSRADRNNSNNDSHNSHNSGGDSGSDNGGHSDNKAPSDNKATSDGQARTEAAAQPDPPTRQSTSGAMPANQPHDADSAPKQSTTPWGTPGYPNSGRPRSAPQPRTTAEPDGIKMRNAWRRAHGMPPLPGTTG
jgi:RNA polymerase sigma-70 factor (ECF subfamily)